MEGTRNTTKKLQYFYELNFDRYYSFSATRVKSDN